MSHSKSKELRLKDKQEITGSAEQTRSGFYFSPYVDIFETKTALTFWLIFQALHRKISISIFGKTH
jgi:hypothetical protein